MPMSFFTDDIVKFIDLPKNLGVVVRSWKQFDDLQKNEIVVCRVVNGQKCSTQITTEDKVELVDRSLLAGDMVMMRANNGSEDKHLHGQIGTVRQVKLKCNLVHPLYNELKLDNVPREHIFSNGFDIGFWVMQNNWIGKITEFEVKFIIMMPDGSLFSPDQSIMSKFEIKSSGDNSQEIFPGDRINGPKSLFKRGKWVHGHYHGEHAIWTGIIAHVEKSSVTVAWKYTNLKASKTEKPKSKISNFEDLFLIESESFAFLVLGSVVHLKEEYLPFDNPILKTVTEKSPYRPLVNQFLVAHMEGVCQVQWQDGSITNLPSTELVACDDLGENDFSPNDFVVLKNTFGNSKRDDIGVIQTVDTNARLCTVKWIDEETGLATGEAHEYSIYELLDHETLSYRLDNIVICTECAGEDWVGIVEEITNSGSIRIRTKIGMKQVTFTDVIRIDEENDESDISDDSSEDTSWETISEGENRDPQTEVWETTSEDENVAPGAKNHPSMFPQKPHSRSQPPEPQLVLLKDCKPFDGNQFMVEENVPIDHAFFETFPPNYKRTQITRNNLPPNIYVCSFEDRLDLFRILIIGSKGTPYDKIPFLFDVRMNEEILRAPSVHYHCWTGGLGKLNPNLYENGNICLSLLGTWEGKNAHEEWNEKSTLLQLFISLQGLVLVREPYYNEANYDKYIGTPEGHIHSIRYIENAYVLSLYSLLHFLTYPNHPFESLVNHLYIDKELLLEIISHASSLSSNYENSKVLIEDCFNQDPNSFPLKCVSKGAWKMMTPVLQKLQNILESAMNNNK